MRYFTLMMAAAAMLSANVALAQSYTLNPQAGSSVENLQGIQLDFTGTQVFFYENNRLPVAVLENTTTGSLYVCETPDRNTFGTAASSYVLNFIPEDEAGDYDGSNGSPIDITEPGNYQLTIRAMYSLDAQGEYVDVDPITADYTVIYPVEYKLNPAPGAVASIGAVRIEFPNTKNIAFYENSPRANAVLSNGLLGNDEVSYVCQEATRITAAESNGAVYEFVFVDEDGHAVTVNTPGQWTLTIAGLYTTDEQDNYVADLPVLNVNYEVVYPVAYTLTPSTDEPVNSLSVVSLEFPNNVNVVFYENNRMPVATLSNGLLGENEEVYYCYEADRNTTATTNGIVYNLVFVDEDGEAANVVTPGVWKLTVNALALEENGEYTDLPVINASYYIPYPVSYDLTPANGAYVTELSKVTVDFPANRNVVFYENSRMPVAVLTNGLEGDAEVVYTCDAPDRNTTAMSEGVVYDFVFVDNDGEAVTLTTPGNWYLTIKGMYLEGETENVDLPVINASYTIPYPVEYVLTPANGSAVESIEKVSVEFPNNRNVVFYENSRMPVAVLTNGFEGDAEVVYTCDAPDRNATAMTEGIVYDFVFVDEDGEAVNITTPGNWNLTIKGMYLEGEEDNVDLPVINASYTIPYPVEYVLTPADGSAVENIAKVSIEFPTDVTVAFYENSRMPVAVLSNGLTGDEEVVYSCYEPDRNTNAESEGVVYDFVFLDSNDEAVNVTLPGNWYLTVKGMYHEVAEYDAEGNVVGEPEIVDLPVINASYTIPYPVEYVLTPANGSAVENIEKVSIEFPNNVNVAFYENSRMPVAVLTNGMEGDAEVVYTCDAPDRNTNAETEGVVYDFVFVDEDGEAADVTLPGNWNLTIRGMYLEVAAEEEGGEAELVDLPVITASYTVVYPIEYVLNPASGSALESIQKVSVEFPNNRNVVFYENSRMPVAVLTNGLAGDEEVVYTCDAPDRNTSAESEGVVYDFVFVDEDGEAVNLSLPGNWYLTIKGMYLEGDNADDNVDLPVINASYLIPYPVEYVLHPSNNSTLTALDKVTVEFPNNRNVAFYENNRMPVAVLTNGLMGDEEVTYTCSDPDRNVYAESEGAVYDFVFMNDNDEVVSINTPGMWKLTIRGMYLEGAEGEDNVDLPAINAQYMITYPIDFELTPADGSQVESIETITLEFPNNNNVEFYENGRFPVAVLTNGMEGDAEVVYTCEMPDRNATAMTEGIVYDLKFVDEAGDLVTVITPGNWYLTVRGLYLNVEEVVEEGNVVTEAELIDLPLITAKYTIAYPIEYVLTPENGANTTGIDNVTLEFPTTKNVAYYENGRFPVAVLSNGLEGDDEVAYYCYEPEYDVMAETEGTMFNMVFLDEEDVAASIRAQGFWYLTIRGFYLSDENDEPVTDLPVINAVYYVDGTDKVTMIQAIDGVYNVYTLNGLKVVSNGDVNSLKALPAGIYVINGQKVLIRK